MGAAERHILVIGPTDFTWRRLRELPEADSYVFHPVIDYDELLSNEPKSFDAFLDQTRSAVQSLQRVDGVMAFWDFPAPCLAACLHEEFGLPGSTLESVLQCEHKHWARKIQRDVVPEVVPDFARVDPMDDAHAEELPLDPPFWLKPIKSASSMLGFRIESLDDYRRAIEDTRQRIHIYGDPFTEALAHAELPDELRKWGGSYCIAEGLIGGKEVTLEGYVRRGEVHFHGVVDSIRYSNASTFSRYEYPSRASPAVVDRMKQTATKLLEAIGYDNATFNIEFFHDEPNDQIWLVEVNPRISQSHAKLFQLVEGRSNFSEMIAVALDRAPPERPGGEFACAAKLFYRTVLEDGIVTTVPSPEEIATLEADIPGVEVVLEVEVGTRLSDLPCQDSYSYELAQLHIGGRDEGEILQKYQECVDRLTFGFRDMDDTAMPDGHHRVNSIPQLMRSDDGAGDSPGR